MGWLAEAKLHARQMRRDVLEEIEDAFTRRRRELRLEHWTDHYQALVDWCVEAVVQESLTGSYEPIPDRVTARCQRIEQEADELVEWAQEEWDAVLDESQLYLENLCDDMGAAHKEPDLGHPHLPARLQSVDVAALISTVARPDAAPTEVHPLLGADVEPIEELIDGGGADSWFIRQWELRGQCPPDGELEPPPPWPTDKLERGLRGLERRALVELHLEGSRVLEPSDTAGLTGPLAHTDRWLAWYEHNDVAPGDEPCAERRAVTLTSLLDGPDELSTLVELLGELLGFPSDPAQVVPAAVDRARNQAERWRMEWLMEQWRKRRCRPPQTRLEPPESPIEAAQRLRAARRQRDAEAREARRAEEAARRTADAHKAQQRAQRHQMKALLDATVGRLDDQQVAQKRVTTTKATIDMTNGSRIELLRPDEQGVVEWKVVAAGIDVAGKTTLDRLSHGDLDEVLALTAD